MGLFSFIKDAGEKLFGTSKDVQAAQAEPAKLPDLNAKAGSAIKTYIETQNLGIQNLAVQYDGASGKVTVTGAAPSEEAAEKVTLCCGNVASVTSVDNQLSFPPGTASQYHDVVSGDTLSAISKKYYGDANQYMKIFEANKPMLSDPNKIYPGQKLRIPAA
ncbi:peptidoglycan-binding protein LysM [Comamonas serinivorans]|uniref:Potassium binding protein Kbp n=1 Tax=Comamonas serinivorans TaxID=1082851 RepID=A0A1Y0ES39_9BURK|nr:peptidoglycan-binding protein LysM [Comamonas serinivorans]ARU06484.1 peptidoglycan-binding protein LysM [Comamonas serinivorans]